MNVYATPHPLGKHVMLGDECLSIRDAEVLIREVKRAISGCERICADQKVHMPGTHDFGSGPVPARRHINPDGSEGGWVASTAHVADNCFIASGAVVYDVARVLDGSMLFDQARVFGSATLKSVIMSDYSKVSGPTMLEKARLFGMTYVHNRRKAAPLKRAPLEKSPPASNPLWE